MLTEICDATSHELLRVARFGEEAKQVSVVDGTDRRVDIGVPRQQHAHGVRRRKPSGTQELGAAHARHPHVGDDDGERVGSTPENAQALGAAGGGVDVEASPRTSVIHSRTLGSSSSTQRMRGRPGGAAGHPAAADRINAHLGSDLEGRAAPSALSGRRIVKLAPWPGILQHSSAPA